MSAAEFEVEVHAPLAKLWDVLLDEMEHPEAYSNTIHKSEVIERFANGLLRRVFVPDAEVREKLVYDFRTYTIVSTLVGHPDLVGVITKTVVAKDKSKESWILCSKLEWESVAPRVEAMLTRNVKDFMMEQLKAVKSKAEGN